MDTKDFDDLMDRYLSGKATPEERAKIDAWLDTEKTGENPAKFELRKQQEEKIFNRINENISEDVTAYVPEHDMKLSPTEWLLRIAASLFVIALATWLVFKFSDDSSERFTAASTEKEKLMLTDGSLVWLDPGAKLAYFEKEKQGIRYAEMTGTALFEIAKDPSRPFLLQCGDLRIQVLGTSFSVTSTDSTLELSVLTGKVNVSGALDSTIVLPNEKLTYRTGHLTKEILPPDEIISLTKNTAYNMKFTDARLGEIAARLEDKFDVDIEFEVRAAADCSITADLTDHSLESSLTMIGEVLDITSMRTGNRITIDGAGCKMNNN